MKNLVCFLEEPSAKEMLMGILPRLLPDDIHCHYIVFEGKQDMDKQLGRKLRGWNKPESAFLVIRDQDSSDCKTVKQKLTDICCEAGKPGALIRIACHELESFYFGDLPAVEKGLAINELKRYGMKAKYRLPDKIENPCDELEKLTKNAYQHIAGSRLIGPFLDLDHNTSHSFNVLITGIRGLLTYTQ